MNELWKYEDYVNHLSHENEIVRRWAFSALENRFLNRYTDQAANLINDSDDHLVCAALRYLSFHRAVQHAPAILERFKSGQGVIASNCAVTLAKMHYEPAIEVMLERFRTAEDSETFFGVLDFLGNVRTEKCRTALKAAVIQKKDTIGLRSAIANLLHHFNPEDINLVMDRVLNSGGSYNRFDTPLKHILSPLGGRSYFRDLTEFGKNELLSKPSETIDNFFLKNSDITVDETLRENLIASLENRHYQDFSAAIMVDAQNIIHARYPQNNIPDYLKEFFGQDTMCLHLLEDLSKRRPVWKQVESSNDFGADLIAFIISAYAAIKERRAYVRALSPEADAEELVQALLDSGPHLPVPIQDKIKVSEEIGRNEPCPCGSGKKNKKCCLNKK